MRRSWIVSLFALTGLLSSVAVQAEELNLRVHNRTALEVKEIQVADSRFRDQAEDVLSAMILPGESVKVQVPTDRSWCLFIVKVVFADGSTTEQPRVPLCQIGDLYIVP